MALFLLGLVSFERGLHIPAQSAFKLISSMFEKASIVALDHTSAGLDFVLSACNAQENELSSAYASTLANKVGRKYPILHRLPAGLIFEDPMAPAIQAACSMEAIRLERSTWPVTHTIHVSPKSVTFDEASNISSATKQPPTASSSEPRSSPLYTYQDRKMSFVTKKDNERYLLFKAFMARLPRAKQAKPRATPLGVQGADRETQIEIEQFSSRPTSYLQDPAQYKAATVRRVMVPRDARPEHHTLHELGNVIRHTGPEYATSARKPVGEPPRVVRKMHHEPRDARPQWTDLTELSNFLKDSDSGAKITKTIKVTGPIESPLTDDSTLNIESVNTNRLSTLYDSVIDLYTQDEPLPSPFSDNLIRSSSIYSRPTNYCYPWEPTIQHMASPTSTSTCNYIDIDGLMMVNAAPRGSDTSQTPLLSISSPSSSPMWNEKDTAILKPTVYRPEGKRVLDWKTRLKPISRSMSRLRMNQVMSPSAPVASVWSRGMLAKSMSMSTSGSVRRARAEALRMLEGRDERFAVKNDARNVQV